MQPFPIWLLPTLYWPRSINRSPPPSLHLSPSALRKTRLPLSTIPIRLLPPYHRAFHPLPVTGSSPSSSSSSLPHPTTVRCLPPHPPAHGRSLSLSLSPLFLGGPFAPGRPRAFATALLLSIPRPWKRVFLRIFRGFPLPLRSAGITRISKKV